METGMHKYFHWGAMGSLVLLIVWCLLWELVLAPLHPGGSWLALKAAPLLIPLLGVFKRDVYTLQWTSMMILVYFTEGVVRGWSDRGALSACLRLGSPGRCLMPVPGRSHDPSEDRKRCGRLNPDGSTMALWTGSCSQTKPRPCGR